MPHQRIKRNSQTLATTHNTRRVESNQKVHFGRTLQPTRQHRQYGKHERGDDLKGDFECRVGEEEGLDAVDAVVVVAVEDVALAGVYGDIVEHADKVEGCNFYDEADAVLDGVVVVF